MAVSEYQRSDAAVRWDDSNAARQHYSQRLASLTVERDGLKRVDRRWHIARGLTFFGGIGLLLLGYLADEATAIAWVGWFALAAFLVVVTLHQRVRDQLEEIRRYRSVLRRLLARLERRWDRLPVWKPADAWLAESGISADVADDLDLFGRGSLFQLVSVAATGPGLRTLAGWLGGPADSEAAEARAEAVATLAPLREVRERFYVLARRAADGTAQPDRFVQWATGGGYLATRRWLQWWARLAPLVIVLAAVAGLLWGGQLALGVSTGAWAAAAVLLVNLLITMLHIGPIHDVFSVALSGRGDVAGYAELFATAQRLPESPPQLAEIRRQLIGDANDPQAQGGLTALSQLQRTASYAAMRQSGVLFIPYLLLQGLALWDVHVLAALERWQDRYRQQAAGWFEALGALEALASLAALRDEYPAWARAEWFDAVDPPRLVAQQIGHPLLPDDQRVTNDVAIGPPGTVLLVTGSNMSGKSTMLRSVGLNAMLAAAGAPVCAAALQLSSLELATSIRVRDSVREGVSFYMAELHRLRSVVQHARELRARPRERVVMYLLDEILQGTNSLERQIAVTRVLGHLIGAGAIGAISTHDLDLADDPLLQQVAQTVHFRETIERQADGSETMTFDYRMRPGVTPTTNALRLLEIVGLGEENEGMKEGRNEGMKE